jgi:parallel beta-helix repeat protein
MRWLIQFSVVIITLTRVVSIAAVINIPGDFPYIQLGISISSNGDTVLVHPGTYTENLDFTGHNIVLGSLFLTTGDTSYISQTVIDGDSSGSAVTFGDWQDSTTAIVGFTITNGLGAGTFPDFEGGGITCQYQAKPRIYKNIITGNSAFAGGGISLRQHANAVIMNNTIGENSSTAGGGIYSYDNNAIIVDNTINENSAIDNGGGILSRSRGNHISGNYIYGNSSYYGGGIFCYSDPSIIDSNIISDNFASYGGGIFCSWYSQPTITNNIIYGNNTTSGGGGIACGHGSPIIMNNVIQGNSGVWGGGINCRYSSNPIISHNIISGNSASDNGGGIYCEDSNPSIANLTLYQNFASGSGGGIYCENEFFTVVNSILWNDSAGTGNEIFINTGSAAFIYCNISGGWPGQGNIDCDPMFCNSDSGDFHIDGNSCCVGAGQNGEIVGAQGIGCWPACDNYVVGDINGSDSYNGLDIIYGVAFLKGGQPPGYLCECLSGFVFYAMGDVNASCSYNGLDITYGVSYLKGQVSELFPCPDCPPGN